MDLQDQLSRLESVRDWQGLLEELERSLAGESASAAKAATHLRLGRLLETKFLQSPKALRHFQDAYKLNPALVEALEEARAIYWSLGKLAMVQKLLDLELKSVTDAAAVSALLIELGDVLRDQGDEDGGAAAYARALGASDGTSAEARACLEDAQVEDETWQDRLGEILRTAHGTQDEADRARSFLRAARIARKFAPSEVESLLAKAYESDPTDRQVAALYEALLVDSGRADALQAAQRAIVDRAGPAVAPRLAFRFGARWATRHQDGERGASWLQEAFAADASLEAAFHWLRESWGTREGAWERVLEIVDGAAQRDETFALAQAGNVAWRQLGNLIRARTYFERLAAVAPSHPSVHAFEMQIGESLAGARTTAPSPVVAAHAAAPSAESVRAAAPAPLPVAPEADAQPAPVSVPAASSPEPISGPASMRGLAVAARAAGPLDAEKVAELRALAAKQEGAKRFNELVRTLVQLAGGVPNAAERVDLYRRAADLYVGKFANQAEAVKCHEAILEIDPDDATSTEFLRQMYEKRRDWEKLIGLQRREAERLPAGRERAGRFLEIARLATEKVKKPDVCIGLWREVLDSDPESVDALASLAGLYERAKDWASLAAVLDKQVDVTYDAAQKAQLLGKLAAVHGDRLADDAGAVEAWQKLLALDPSDRKAQEALKKKYIALGRWDDLEVFYAESGKWDELIRVLEAQEAKEQDGATKIALLLKIAQLWSDKRQKSDRAAKSYEKVLELDPSHLGAAEAIAPIYAHAGNHKGLASALEVRLQHETDPFARLDLLREVASLYETKIKDTSKAFERSLAAFEISPADEACADDLERLAAATDRWDEVVAAYGRAVDAGEAEGDARLSLVLRMRLGNVLVERLGRVDDAITAFRAVHDAEPDNAEAFASLERLYRRTSRFADLLDVYARLRDLATDGGERRRLLESIAGLYERELGDAAKAIDTWRSALDEDPSDAAALASLDRLYGEQRAWEPYVEVLRRRIELDVPEAELVDLKLRLGRTLEDHLGDAAGALETFREILLLDPGHDAARERLEALLANGALKAEAAAILEGIYEVREDWTKLVGVLRVLADAEEDVSRRVQIRRKIARIADASLGDLALAFDAQALALSDDPTQEDSRAELERLAAAAGAWDRLEGVLERIAESLDDAQLARDYFLRLAQAEERLGKIDEAAHHYERVLDRDASDAEALDALEQLWRGTERWTDLVKVFRRRLDLAGDFGVRESLHADIASVWEEKLGRADEAIATYQALLAEDATSRVALVALDGLFVRRRMWPELVANLDAQLALAEDDATQTALMIRVAALRESEMGEIAPAIEIYRQVLEREPSHAGALAALERIGADPEHELAAAEILEPLYRAAGDHAKLIGVHEVQVRRAEDAARRVELLHRIAELQEDAAGDTSGAFDTIARALREDPAREDTLQALERLARATGRHADFAAVLEQLASLQSDVTLAVALWSLGARVHQHDLGDVESAIRWWRQALSLDQANLAAAEALEDLFRGAERWSELSGVLQHKAGILDGDDDRKNALYQAAQIEEEILGRRESAIAVYRKILAADAEDLRSLDALIRLHAALGQHHDLLAAYAQKVELVGDIDEQKSLLHRMGEVWERELSNATRAVQMYGRVLELDPDDLAALRRLDALHAAAGAWPELLAVLQREAELATDSDEAIGFEHRIAELYETHLGDPSRAIELYREILARDPSHAATLAALEKLKDGTVDPLGAAAVLEPVYESAGDWARLVRVLEVQARGAEDPLSRVDLLHRVARLHEENLADHVASFDAYARALALDSGNDDTLSALERLAPVVDRWTDLARLYEAELGGLADDPERAADLGLRAARIWEDQVADAEAAIRRYSGVAALLPENEEALRALDRLYVATSRWSELADVLVREADLGQTPEEILELKHRLGQLREHHLGDVGGAITAYREILAAAPEYAPTLVALEKLFAAGTRQLEIAEILEPIYQAGEQWDDLLRVHEAQLAQLAEPSERLAMLYRMAELIEERLYDPARALTAWVRVLGEAPLDDRGIAEAERLAAGVESGWESLANAYADVLGMHEDPLVQTSIGRRLARVFEEELGDVQKADETYQYVLGVEPLDDESLANLDRIYSALEQWDRLAAILEQRVRATGETADLVDLWARLGEVYEERLGRVDDAVRAYRKIFDGLDESHEGAIAALARIYEQRGAWRDLDAVYERQLANASGDVQEAEIRARTARLAAEKLGDPARAIETWKRVLDLRGEDPEALGALAELYDAGEQWAELCDVLERQYDIADDDERRVAVLARRARLFTEKLDRDEQALADWQRVLDVDYANLDALRAVADVWRKRRDGHELVAALHQIVDRAAALLDGAELVALWRELAETYANVLEQPFDAAEAWKQLLEIEPRDLAALDALEAIWRAQEQWTDVIAVKTQRAEVLEDAEARVREWLDVAALWEEPVGERDRGAAAYERVLQIDPRHDRAFEALESLHVEAGRWEPLVELYLARLDSREVAAERTELLRRIARVFDEKLGDKGQAFDALVNALSEDYGDDATVKYLEKVTGASSRWAELVQTANGWLGNESDERRKIQLCLRLAKWYGEDLARPEYAQPYFQQVVQLDPNNVAVLRQMASLYRKNGQWRELGQTLTRALDVATVDADRCEILTELGDVLERHVGDIDQAIAHYRRALDVRADHLAAIESLERIFTARKDDRELVAILARKVAALTDPAEIVHAKLRMAGLYEGALDDLAEAARIYAEAVEADPGSLEALRGLERIHARREEWPELAEVLERQLDVVTSERERIDTLLELARVQEEQFVKPDLAAQRLEQALEIDPAHEGALAALARCYRRLRQWHDLIGTYERHVPAASERSKKIELYELIAGVFADELDDLDRAIEAWRNVVDIDDANVPALDALSRLYDKQGEASEAIEYMTRVADLTTDGKQRVEMYFRIGKALDEKLGDRMLAQERFEQALDLDPAHLPSLASLRQIALDAGDWDKAARLLDDEQRHTPAPRQRAKLLVELGKLRDEMLGEHDLAVKAWEQALELDADSEDAAGPLLDEYVRVERWKDAEPIAELLVRRAGKRDRADQHRVWNLLGRVSAALGKHDRALKAFGEANKLDATDQDTIRGLADAAFELQDWATALANFQKVLAALDEAETEARASVYFKLGAIKRAQGQAKQAVGNFEKALQIDPAHRPSLDALIEIHADLKDWKTVCAYKRQILDEIIDGPTRFKMLLEIADVWADKDKSPDKAIEALEEAAQLEPRDHVLLHKLLGLYQSVSSWARMVETLESIADLETNSDRKAKYVYTMAQIQRDKLGDMDRAVELFERTLDLNPTMLEAFERINKILTGQRDWKALERAFRKMLHRVAGKGNVELEYNLWHSLGIIYRDRLAEPKPAIEAFKMASRAKPDEVIERQILAELFEATDQVDLAIEQEREILARDPLRVEPYRALYRLYVGRNDYDAAWCLCAALSFLRKAEPDEQKFFEDYRPQGMLQVKSRLDNELWVKNLFHADENLYIGKIFEMLAAAALTAKMLQLKSAKQLPILDKRYLQNPVTSTVTFAKTFGWAAQVLGVQAPELYVRSDVPGALAAVPAAPPASVAGQSVLTGFQPQELTFICGKHLSYYRGEHYLKTLFPTVPELTMLLFAGVRMISPEIPVPADIAPQVQATATELAKFMQPIHIEGLRLVVKRFIEDGAKANVKRWSQAAELTACRAGLLLCADLEIAKKIVAAEPQVPGDLPPQDKMKELLVFSVSPQYFALRKALGIAVG